MRHSIYFVFSVCLLLLTPAFGGDNATDRGDVRIANPPQHPAPIYKIEAGIDGEIYPVFEIGRAHV